MVFVAVCNARKLLASHEYGLVEACCVNAMCGWSLLCNLLRSFCGVACLGKPDLASPPCSCVQPVGFFLEDVGAQNPIETNVFRLSACGCATSAVLPGRAVQPMRVREQPLRVCGQSSVVEINVGAFGHPGGNAISFGLRPHGVRVGLRCGATSPPLPCVASRSCHELFGTVLEVTCDSLVRSPRALRHGFPAFSLRPLAHGP